MKLGVVVENADIYDIIELNGDNFLKFTFCLYFSYVGTGIANSLSLRAN